MPAWVLDARGKPGSARRLAWLEAEYSRLGFECQHLEAVNAQLSRRIEGESSEDSGDGGDDGDEDRDGEGPAGDEVTSLDQIHLSLPTSEPPIGRKGSRTLSHHSDESVSSGHGEHHGRRRSKKRPSKVCYKDDAAQDGNQDFLHEESRFSITMAGGKVQNAVAWMGVYANAAVMKGSALGRTRPVQAVIYLAALGGIVFVLLSTALHLGVHAEEGDHGSDHGAEAAGGHAVDASEHHRRLGGAAPPLLKNIAFSLVGAGLISFFVNILKQPLIIGYILGGILVGPLCLGIVQGHAEIDVIAELGLLFLLFMIGMELDFHRLWRMERVVFVAGLLQFPVCAGAMYLIFAFLKEVAGLSFGSGSYPILYISLTCAVSSTMIVVKLLAEKFEADSPAGRLSTGILICQDIWAIVILAIQPAIDKPEAGKIAQTFAMIAVLIIVALAYAKFVMPPVLFNASKSVELMLVLSLSWCFFICSAAVLPFVGLSMELAALIAGTALATFPYSQDFNGKIKYIRDFFITLFFASVGMQVPVPTGAVLAKAVLVVVVVLVMRWLSIFAMVMALGGEPRMAALSTIHLSQISEFALVICIMGMGYGGGFGHIEEETMTIVIWAFSILVILSTYANGHSQQAVRALASMSRRALGLCRVAADQEQLDVDEEEIYTEEHRDILLLGFHKIAAMLIAEFQMRSPEILQRIHVIDINPGVLAGLREKGIRCSWGDFASAKELSTCHKGDANIVISSTPDSMLQGVTNLKMLKVVSEVWPNAHFIATADNPYQAQQLYEAGADYVVRMAKLCAERLHELLSEHCKKAFGSGELEELFAQYKGRDKDARSRMGFLSLQV